MLRANVNRNIETGYTPVMGLVLTRYGRRGDSQDDPRAEPLIFDNPQISDIYLGPAVPNILNYPR